MILTEKDQARFWSQVALPNEQGCMLWLGSHAYRGYGKFWINGSSRRAHRISYEVAYGPIAADLVIDHLCRVHGCVAPAHLEAVTQRENVLRGDGVSAGHAKKTHCPLGHPYDAVNTYVYPAGKRGCRECHRTR